jgi:hypothetical protein
MSEAKILEKVDVYRQLDEINEDIAKAEDKLKKIITILSERKQTLHSQIKDYAEQTKWSKFDPAYLSNFIEEPYVIEPARTGPKGNVIEWHVYVPKMVQFHVGRLERATHSYNVFTVTQYMHHFAEIPEELSDRFPKLEIELQVVDGLLITDPQTTEQAWSKYRQYLYQKEGPGKLRIKKGSEWEIIAQILEDGGLPFSPHPVDQNDVRPRSFPEGFAGHKEWKIRDYQIDADQKFMEYGAIGVYWPFGTGKSQYAEDLIDRLKGAKLIIVSTLSLKEQWLERLKLLSFQRQQECFLVTYHSKNEIDRLITRFKEFVLIVFDEVHHLPANTFMRLSTIPCKYRLGLTGSPYREDGHINYIMALTGYPLGLAWSKFIAEGIITMAQVQVHVVAKERYKLALLDDLLKRDLGKTMIFCDSLDLGNEIAKKYGLEWIHGATRKRIETIRRNERVVISRVGDEGLSIPELDTLIEIDFLGGCYDEQTEVLTQFGWKYFKDITSEDEIATLNEDECIEYQKPTALQKYSYEGAMIHFLGKCYDLLVTPNHEMWVRPKWKAKFTYKRAEELAKLSKGGIMKYEFKRDAKWKGVDRPTFPITCPMNQFSSKTLNIPIDIFLDFLGWYISDGSCGKWGIIKIDDPKEKSKLEIAKIIERLGFTPKITRYGVYFYSRPLSKFLRNLGSASEKFIPDWIKQLPSHRLKRLIQTLLKGDGSENRKYSTASKKLADDLQEICLKSGCSSSISKRNRNPTKLKDGRTITPNFPEYTVYITKKPSTPEIETMPTTEEYTGIVYDVTVPPNHIIFVRRNGKAIWCSNSRMQALQRIGRLAHRLIEPDKEPAVHHILMTEEELEKYGKRLLAYYDKGYKVDYLYHGVKAYG